MKKWQLGKKKMLGFLTAGAIVVTMAGSYAVWDTLKAETETTTLTLDKPVTTTLAMTANTFTPGTRQLGTENTYTDSATYTVTNVPDGTPVAVVIQPTIKVGDADVTDEFDINIDSTAVANGKVTKDVTIEAGNATATYDVSIKPKENISDVVKAAATAGTPLDVKLTSVLQKATTP